jgi:hypothetical protein
VAEKAGTRYLTLGVSVLMFVIALVLVCLAAVIAARVAFAMSKTDYWLFSLSVVLTFALFFSAMAWRGFSAVRRPGPALTTRGWRLLAVAFVLIGGVGALDHWAGLVLPFVVAFICLLADPAMLKLLRRMGFIH